MISVVDYALQFIGLPYLYGGKCPIVGLDCSGLVCELLRYNGALKNHEQFNAQQLYDKLYMQGKMNVRVVGSLAFYGDNDKSIDHVAFMIDSYRVIEAAGGDHTTLTRDDSIKANAFVRIRPVDYRKDFICTLLPGYPLP